VNFASFYFGRVAVLPFSLLWIPVSRGSPLLRLVGIPFERAVRYHIWLSICMIVLVSLHSIGYILLYASTGRAHLVCIIYILQAYLSYPYKSRTTFAKRFTNH
jgi:hypothetical protein